MKLNNKKQQINSRWNSLAGWFYEKSDSIIPVVVIMIIIGLSILWAMAIEKKPLPSCEKYINYSIDDLPVRCFDYFGIQTYRYIELKK